jgi:VanZ family protein
MDNAGKKLRNISIVIWVMCIILVTFGSLLPQIYVPDRYNIDKIVHCFAYASLAFIAYFFTTKRYVHIIFYITIIAIGGGIEIIQTFLPPRSGTIGDFAADVTGVFIGTIIAVKLKPWLIKCLK